MGTDQALVVSDSAPLHRVVTRAVASAGFDVQRCSADQGEVSEAIDRCKPRICVVDVDGDPGKILPVFDVLSPHPGGSRPAAVLLSHTHETPLLHELFVNRGQNNLVGKHRGVSEDRQLIDEIELISTCHKLISKDVFGLEKYLCAWGIEIHEHVLHASDERTDAIAAANDFLQRIDCCNAIKGVVELVAEELLINAIFNAPRDDEGRPKYVERDRRDRFALEPRERVKLRFGCDGRVIALSVADQFGSLDRDRMLQYLGHCFTGRPAVMERKVAGAGLGLAMVFNATTQLTFNIASGAACEVLAVFFARGGGRAFFTSGRSLNIFERAAAPDAGQ